MRPWLRVPATALVAGLIAITAGTASAQFYDAARQTIGFGPDPLARSARLAGMGRLTVVGDDSHNQVTLWDFASNPAGIADDDTASTFEIRPGSGSASSMRDLSGGRERQILAGRELGMGFEGWRRTKSQTAYGAIGEMNELRLDEPYSLTSERRTSLSSPNLMAVVTGRVPYLLDSPRWRYALRAVTTHENALADYLSFVTGPTGEYIDQDGATLTQPQFLVPNEYNVTTTGGGAALRYDFGRALAVVIGGDALSSDVQGDNDGDRYHAEIHERRPTHIGQASMVGKLGSHLDWGLDGKLWSGNSEQSWDFTVSAGIGAEPLTGRGKLLRRDEHGTAGKARARWVQGPFELGAAVSTRWNKVAISPPSLNDRTSFNYFLNTVTLRPGADTLALPDSIVRNTAERRTWEAAGGVAWNLPGRRGKLGVEYHAGRDDLVQTVAGNGPRRVVWEMRTGLEYRCSSVLSGRAGYLYGSDNRDKFIYGNRYGTGGVALGVGLHPERSVWSIDAGYLLAWYRIKDGDPTQPRGTRQQFAAQVRWAL